MEAHNQGDWAEDVAAQPRPEGFDEPTWGGVGGKDDVNSVGVGGKVGNKFGGEEFGVFSKGGDEEVVVEGWW